MTAATVSRPVRRRRPLKPASIAIAVGVVVLLVFELYPLVWLFLSSFKTQNEFTTEPVWSLPSTFSFDNYALAITTGNIGQYAINSVLTVFPALAVLTVLGVAGAFALEVMVWKGRGGVLL